MTGVDPVHIIRPFYFGLIAQSVEQGIENPCVPGSIPGQATIFYKLFKLSLDDLFAGVVELVDTPDLGSGAFGVRVRVSPSAPYSKTSIDSSIGVFLCLKFSQNSNYSNSASSLT